MQPKKTPPKKEIATITDNDTPQLPAIIPPPGADLVGGDQVRSEAARAFLDRARGQRLVPTSIPLIKIMHSEGQFLLPTGELVDRVSGYPVYYYFTRRWYKKAFQAGSPGTPPDCWSADMLEPHRSSVDKQSDRCNGCPQNEFGTSRTGRGMACAAYTWVFLINPKFGRTPLGVLVVPPSSLKVLTGSRFQQGYFAQAEARHEAHEIVWTTFGLVRSQEEAVHCVLAPTMGPAADTDRAKVLVAIRNKFLDMMESMRMSTPDLKENETSQQDSVNSEPA